MWYRTLLLGIIFITSTSSADKAVMQVEKTRVLIVPFDRVDFYSQVEVPILLGSNGFTDDKQIYPAYKKELIRVLGQERQNFSFFELPESEAKVLKQQVPTVHKMTPVSHYGVDLSLLRDSTLIKRYLSNFGADYILFLCRYEINTKPFISSKSFDGSTFVNWSRHEIDYELFNSEQKLVAMASSFTLTPRQPTDSTYLTYGVRLEGMSYAFEDLQEDIIRKEKRYKGKPIYKIKRKNK
ncbi:MAG: hypothetical protein RJQ00_10035 [Vicingaceae bacterium]